MNHISQIIESLAGTTKRKEKEQILSDVIGTKLEESFLKLCELTMSDTYKYNIDSGIPKVEELREPEEGVNILTMDEMFAFFEEHGSNGGFRTDEKRELLIDTLSRLSNKDLDLAYLILRGTLDCGVSGTTINKVWPNQIFIAPYCRCSTLNEKTFGKLKAPYWVQTKLDGSFQNIIITRGGARFFTRDWEEKTDLLRTEQWVKIGALMEPQAQVLHGEALVIGEDGKYLPRAEGNGYLNRDDIDHSRVVFVVWDSILLSDFWKGKSDELYMARYARLCKFEKAAKQIGLNVEIVDTTEANTLEEIEAIYRNARSRGEEGVVVKSAEMIWKHGTSTEQLKCKVVVDCEMKVVGWRYGEDKYEGMVGALEIESSDGKVSCRVGSGLSDKQRADTEFWDRMVEEGGIVTVRYNDVTTNEDRPDVYALYLPRLVEVRTDKDTADTYETIKEQLSTVELF